MANTKISALTSSTTPLAGTEVLPIVQSSATVKVAVSDLTAGRSVSMSAGTISSGNLTFSSTSQRITGDFSNATNASRVSFQTSTVNGGTIVQAMPNGTGTFGIFRAVGSSDPDNASILTMQAIQGGTQLVIIRSDITGTGTYLPMTFYTGGSERVRIDTSGSVGIGGVPDYKLDVYSGALRINGNARTVAGDASIYFGSNTNNYIYGGNANNLMVFATNGAERMRIESSGNVLVTNPAGLGYGTGAGGTVTQATSRTTGVTLSKPTGAITMFSAAGSIVAATFTVTNTLVAATDTIILNQKSGTNLYVLLVTAVAAGSFNITFYTTGGVATDAPVINFSLIKGVTA
jgi:hypothetical protein